MSLSNTPPTQPGISAEAGSLVLLQAAGTRAQTPREGLLRRFNGGILMGIVVVIALLWSVPTFGLFVASLRPAALDPHHRLVGGLVPPWHFTIENYQQVLSGQGRRTRLHQQPDHRHSGHDHPGARGRLRRLRLRLDEVPRSRLRSSSASSRCWSCRSR